MQPDRSMNPWNATPDDAHGTGGLRDDEEMNQFLDRLRKTTAALEAALKQSAETREKLPRARGGARRSDSAAA